jgi:hypothetical protein
MEHPDFVLHGLDKIAGVDTVQLHAAGASTLAFSVTGTKAACREVHAQIMRGATSAALDGMLISIRGIRSAEIREGYRFDCKYDPF